MSVCGSLPRRTSYSVFISDVCLNCGRAEVGQQLTLLSANPESTPLVPWEDGKTEAE